MEARPPSPRPSLPIQRPHVEAGRAWLSRQHSISGGVIGRAEQQRFVHYYPNDVAFLGWTDGKVHCALRHPKDERWVRFAEHSDEACAPVLLGDPSHVVLCAGGIAALKRLTELERNQASPPTVIVLRPNSPLVGLDRLGPELRDQIAKAREVTFAGFQPDAMFLRLLDQIRGVPPENTDYSTPVDYDPVEEATTAPDPSKKN